MMNKPAFINWSLETINRKQIYKIQPARIEDIDELLKYPDNKNQTKEFLLSLIETTRTTSNLFLLIIVNSKIVGEFVFVIENNEGSIMNINILEKYWGLGIGTELMKLAIDVSKKNNLKKIWLAVLKTNTRAQELYERMGFKKIPNHKKETPIRWIYELKF